MDSFCLNLIGLICNFVGTLLLVFYISVDKKEWVEGEKGQKPGEKWFSVLIKYPHFLRIGIILISIGFLFSIIAEVLSYRSHSYQPSLQESVGNVAVSQPATSTIPHDIAQLIAAKEDLIVVTLPKGGELITSPQTITGRARGYWFFEGSFPIVLTNWDGLIIAESYATAVLDPADPSSTWMTEDFVDFEGSITFPTDESLGAVSNRGTLILQKANPSGLPEHDDVVEIPVVL